MAPLVLQRDVLFNIDMTPSTAPESSGATDRDAVLEDANFEQVLESFIDTAVAKAQPVVRDDAFAVRYRDALVVRAQANRAAVDGFQTSSIEKIILRWLLLAGVKWDPVGLLLEPLGAHGAAAMDMRRQAYARFQALAAAQPPEAAGSTARLLDAVAHTGLAGSDAEFLRELALRRGYFDSARTVHVVLQPDTLPIDSEGQAFRPDLYFWSPALEGLALLVECAGFQSHATGGAGAGVPPIRLPADFLTLRLTGIEMFRDPVDCVSRVLGVLQHEVVRAASSEPASSPSPAGTADP